jgi:predicted Rossmann fold flavoprotein
VSVPRRIAIVGGGAAGFFAAITCAEKLQGRGEVTLYEATSHLLAKVKISGGGRCNVTHSCFEPRALAEKYPRGGRELLGAFHRFQPQDTIAWFAARGVATKTEADGRMFPISDDSSSIVDCLLHAARAAGVKIQLNTGVTSLQRSALGLQLQLTTGATVHADRVLFATGGNKSSAGLSIAASLGHTIIPPLPSLFTFNLQDARLADLSGLSVEKVTLQIPETKLNSEGPLLITHWGLSGPAILKLSAWGARILAEKNYQFELIVNWVPALTAPALLAHLTNVRQTQPRKQINTFSPVDLPQRLWERLLQHQGITLTTPWAHVNNATLQTLCQALRQSTFKVQSKSTYKDEFVTCGGVKLSEINFATMESRLCPHVHFAGEVIDVDGVTGGFNFQNAWTTGFLAGQAMAESS